MTPEPYNYSTFDMEREQPIILAFSELSVRPGTVAPSLPVEDLESGEQIEMKELWREGLAIIEFGSFT